MKPRLKPKKGWQFRLILIDHHGIVVFADFKDRNEAHGVVDRLLHEVTKARVEMITGQRR